MLGMFCHCLLLSTSFFCDSGGLSFVVGTVPEYLHLYYSAIRQQTILSISPPKCTQRQRRSARYGNVFNKKVLTFCLVSAHKHMLWYSLKSDRRGTSNEYQRHMCSCSNTKCITRLPPCIWSYTKNLRSERDSGTNLQKTVSNKNMLYALWLYNLHFAYRSYLHLTFNVEKIVTKPAILSSYTTAVCGPNIQMSDGDGTVVWECFLFLKDHSHELNNMSVYCSTSNISLKLQSTFGFPLYILNSFANFLQFKWSILGTCLCNDQFLPFRKHWRRRSLQV